MPDYTDEELRKRIKCAPLLEEPAAQEVIALASALLREREKYREAMFELDKMVDSRDHERQQRDLDVGLLKSIELYSGPDAGNFGLLRGPWHHICARLAQHEKDRS